MSKLRKFARNQECTLRIPGVCNGNSETVVLCHGRGAGFATKTADYIGVHGCAACHRFLDSTDADNFHRYFAPALRLTLNRAWEAGLIEGDIE